VRVERGDSNSIVYKNGNQRPNLVLKKNHFSFIRIVLSSIGVNAAKKRVPQTLVGNHTIDCDILIDPGQSGFEDLFFLIIIAL